MHSQWHVSALLSTAIETMTLPSRLKIQGSRRETIDQLVNALNINGNQKIAKLRMSIDQKEALNGHSRPGRLEVGGQSNDVRMPSQDRRANESHDEEDESGVSTFDMEFFPESHEQNGTRRTSGKSHVFGQAESHRGPEDTTENEATEDEGIARARRRAAGLPIIQRSVHPLSFWKSLEMSVQYSVLYFSYSADLANFTNFVRWQFADSILQVENIPTISPA